jgi:hypothetical protein
MENIIGPVAFLFSRRAPGTRSLPGLFQTLGCSPIAHVFLLRLTHICRQNSVLKEPTIHSGSLSYLEGNEARSDTVFVTKCWRNTWIQSHSANHWRDYEPIYVRRFLFQSKDKMPKWLQIQYSVSWWKNKKTAAWNETLLTSPQTDQTQLPLYLAPSSQPVVEASFWGQCQVTHVDSLTCNKTERSLEYWKLILRN